MVAVYSPLADGNPLTSRPTAGRGRVRVNVDVVDTLAARLTPRDRYLCRMLHEHRVLTVAQVADLAFDSLSAAQHRLVILYRQRLIDRFRPFRPTGSAPFHYVLDRGGATVLATERGVKVDKLGYRRDKTLGLAHSQRLAHLVATNGFFAALAASARRSGDDVRLAAWWPETRCDAAWGDHVHPDGYGQWQQADRAVEFFLECDRGTEPHERLAAKLDGYRDLADATNPDPAIATRNVAVLLWFHSPLRESAFHARIRHAGPLTVATAVAAPHRNPAGPVWRRVGDRDAHRVPLIAAAHIPLTDPSDERDKESAWRLALHIRRADETAVDPSWPPPPPGPYEL